MGTQRNINQDKGGNLIIEEIEFRSPDNVGKSITELNIDDPDNLKPNQVVIKSLYSLISSGTELKIFKGSFDEAALDVNIKGMDDQSMKYPLSYGYSMVGVVIRCGENVTDAQDIIGKTVFSFSPHASHIILDRESIHVVPNGISPQDAIFMPSVETALSIVHDAHIRLGENVAIYGQGLIGLLVNAILSNYHGNHDNSSSSSSLGRLTVFDTLPDRLAMASTMGASQALLPSESEASGPFDVSIEVSGNSRALQSAIDHTRDGGRIVIGSWYGNSSIELKLGIDFHRSHKTIKTSQVSSIPAELSQLWDKKRRFDLSWELVRLLKPSRLITKTLTLDRAQDAYEALDKGQEIAIAFEYK
jgi:threonine dehydrogenase-like Zn-dependent dehydrogenase